MTNNNNQVRAHVGGTYPHHPLPASPIVREAECIITANWKKAARKHKRRQAVAIMVLVYGATLWLLAALCVAVILVPVAPGIGIAAILAMSLLSTVLVRTWVGYWRSL